MQTCCQSKISLDYLKGKKLISIPNVIGSKFPNCNLSEKIDECYKMLNLLFCNCRITLGIKVVAS